MNLKPLIPAGAYILVWLIFDYGAASFEIAPGVSIWYPPHAVSLAFLMTCGLRYFPALIVAPFIGGSLIWMPGEPMALLVLSCVIAIGYTLAAYAAIYFFSVDSSLESPEDVMLFTICCLIGASVTAPLSILVMIAFDLASQDQFLTLTFGFWAGDMIGTMLLTPLLLVLVTEKSRRKFSHLCRQHSIELLALTLSILGCAYLMIPTGNDSPLFTTTLMFPPLIWAAMRFGTIGTSLYLATFSVGVLLSAIHFDPQISESDMQIFFTVIALIAMLFGAEVSRRQNLLQEAKIDPGTGLANKISFTEQLSEQLRTTTAKNLSFNLTLCDIAPRERPHLSVINDEYNYIIRSAGLRLQSVLDEAYFIARIADFTFAILSPPTKDPGSESEALLRSLQQGLAARVQVMGTEVRLHSRVGIAVAPRHGTTAAELLQCADAALSEAKMSDTDVAVVYSRGFFERQIRELRKNPVLSPQ